jgi:restriction system protein
MRPLLEFGADGREKNINDAIREIANRFELTPEEREQLLPSGKQPILANRVHWARTYLDKAGALRRTRRSHFEVTDRGRELLARYPERIEARDLRQFPEFIAFQTPRSEDDPRLPESQKGEPSPTAPLPEEALASTPEEAIQAAEQAISSALRTQLLDRIRELPPSFFERLVVDLIVAMGYGGTRESVVQRLGKSGDEGIDEW